MPVLLDNNDIVEKGKQIVLVIVLFQFMLCLIDNVRVDDAAQEIVEHVLRTPLQ